MKLGRPMLYDDLSNHHLTAMKTPTSKFLDLPLELYLHIFLDLEPPDLLTLGQVRNYMTTVKLSLLIEYTVS